MDGGTHRLGRAATDRASRHSRLAAVPLRTQTLTSQAVGRFLHPDFHDFDSADLHHVARLDFRLADFAYSHLQLHRLSPTVRLWGLEHLVAHTAQYRHCVLLLWRD